MEFFQENWLPVLVALYLAGMVLYGHYRGFIRLAVSLTALIITLVIVRLALPYVTDYIQENTTISESVKESVIEAIGLDEELCADGTMAEDQIIGELNLPESIKRELISNSDGEIYQLFGIEALASYIGDYLSDTIIQGAAFIILFAIVFIMIQIAVRWLDLIAKLPVLHGINQLAGAALGGILGLLYFWVACLVLAVFSGTDIGGLIMQQIEDCGWLYALYHNNLLGVFVLGIVRGIF